MYYHNDKLTDPKHFGCIQKQITIDWSKHTIMHLCSILYYCVTIIHISFYCALLSLYSCMKSNPSSFVLYLDHPLLFTDQIVQFTHYYIIFAKINGIFIKETVVQNPYKLVYKVIKYALQINTPNAEVPLPIVKMSFFHV